MSKKKDTNGNGRHHHYDLGDEIGRIKSRINKIERNLKIIRTMTPNPHWNLAKEQLAIAEGINESLTKLYEEAVKLDIGDFTDL